jgi:hypothetical protein
MREHRGERSRLGAMALGISGVLFAAFPIVRPFYIDLVQNPDNGAQVISSPNWMISHLLLILALGLLPFGSLTVFAALASTDGRRLALIGMVLGIAGGSLFLPVGGVEAFALPAIARLYLQGQIGTLDAIAGARSGLQATVLVPGLVFLALGGVFTAIAGWRSNGLPRWAVIPFAIGLVFFMPLLPQAVRVIDGVLIGIGALGIAGALWREPSDATAADRHRVQGEAALRLE